MNTVSHNKTLRDLPTYHTPTMSKYPHTNVSINHGFYIRRKYRFRSVVKKHFRNSRYHMVRNILKKGV